MTSSRRFVVVTFAVYSVLTFWLTLRHEPWCDEAQSWLLMRDGGIGTMLSRTGYEGIPALWYLTIAPFAAAGFPITAQGLVNAAFACGAVLILLLRAPFSAPLKVALSFSYYLGYEYSVLARPYALMVLLMFGIAALWESRHRHPWSFAAVVALLANTTTHGLILAGVILIVTVRSLKPAGTLLMALGLLLSALQLRVPADGPRVLRYVDPQTIPYAVGSAFLPGVGLRTSFAVGVCVVVAVIAAIHRDRRALLFLLMSGSALTVLFVFVWMGGLRHAGLLLVIAVTALWIARTDDRGIVIAQVALFLTLGWSIVTAAQSWNADWRWAYSGGREMGRFIMEHNLQRFEIAAHPMNETKSVFAFVPKKQFWLAAAERYGTYSTWGRDFDRQQSLSIDTVIGKASRHFAGRPWLLLTNTPVQRPNLNLLYENRQRIYARPTEHFYLYRCEF